MATPIDITGLTADDLPHRLGRYQLVGLLGRGGMGTVFDAVLIGRSGFQKPIALKVLRRDVSVDPVEARAELAREARIGALLSHPNVVDTYDLDLVGGQLCVAMERIEGFSLLELLRRQRPLPTRSALDLMIQTCAGLAHAHRLSVDGAFAGLVHCDLKPGNILIDQWGMVRIADFGIAAMQSAAGQLDERSVRGTPTYMSPEQLLSAPLDGRSDLWGLGIILCQILVGRRPWRLKRIETARETVYGLVERELPAMLEEAEDLLPGIGAVIGRCLAPEPEDRFASAGELRRVLLGLRRNARGPTLEELVAELLGAVDETPLVTEETLELVIDAPSRFIGRVDELKQLDDALVDGLRLVTLRGPAGVGKSRLVKRWLSGVDHHGVVVDLRQARTDRHVLDATARALGMQPGSTADQELASLVGDTLAARTSMVLTLDGVDQVIDSLRDVVPLWLAAAPGLLVVATSRTAVQLEEERVVALQPMPAEEAMALLIDRAAGRAGYKSTWKTDQAALAKLVERLDRLPLALELAASRAAELSPAALLAQLQSEGGHGAVLRLQDALEVSWALLDEAGRAALAQLSVFESCFDLPLAQALLVLPKGSGWPIHILEELHARSLVTITASGQYELLSVIRDFSRSKMRGLRSEAATRLRHVLCFERLEMGSPEDPTTFHRAVEHVPDLLAAARYASRRGHWEASAQIALKLGLIEWSIGKVGAVPILERILSQVRGDLHLECLARLASLRVRHREEDADSEVASLQRLARDAGDMSVEALAWELTGRLANARGELDGSIEAFGRSIRLARQAGDPTRQVSGYSGLALTLRMANALEQAEDAVRRGLVLAERFRLRRELARLSGILATIHAIRGQYPEGEAAFLKAARESREVGDRVLEAISLCNLTILYVVLGHMGEAERSGRRARRVARACGALATETTVTNSLANIARLSGREVEARLRFAEVERLAEVCRVGRWTAIARGNCALLDLDTGQPERALPALLASAEALDDVMPVGALAYRATSVECFAVLGREQEARAAMERVLAHLNVGDHVAVGRVVHLRLARARYALGEDITPTLAELLAEERAPNTEDALLLDDLTSGAFASRFGLS